MKRLFMIMLVLNLAVVACTKSETARMPTVSPTPGFQTSLSQPASLFSGPGNVNYENLAELTAGTVVSPIAIFGDFVKVITQIGGKEISGFIWNKALQPSPQELGGLDALAVPWEPMYLPSCAPGVYDPESNSVTFVPGKTESWYSSQSAVWKLESPVRMQVDKLSMDGSGSGSVSLIGKPAGEENPSVWWQGMTALSVESVSGNYVLKVLDGSSENPVAMIDLRRSSSQPIQILFDQPEGKSFAVLDADNLELQRIDLTILTGVNLPQGLFPDRNFYFSISASGKGKLNVIGLNIGTKPEGKWLEAGASDPGLAVLADEKNLLIGSVYDRSNMIDRRYCQSMQREFNVVIVPDITWIVPGVAFWLGPGQYYFDNVDRVVEIAQQNGWRVFGSHLVWGAPGAYPDWLRNGDYTRDEYIAFLEQHIKTMIERYKGKIQYWSIANEAPERDYYYPTPYVLGKPSTNPDPGLADFWYEKIGPEYIAMAFRWAKEADPDAILIYNSSVVPSPLTGDAESILDQMYRTVKELKQNGVPIDAIGTQLHLLGPLGVQVPPQKESLIEFMQKFAALGVRVYITEFEVDLGSTGGTQEERYAYQAQIYRDTMEACLESGVCDGFITWGVSDSLSYITCSQPNSGCLNEPTGDPLMFDRDFNPKPAYYAVSDALQGIAVSNPVIPTPPPTTQEFVDACVAQLAPASPSADSSNPDSYDNFDNPTYEGAYNRSIWSPQISFPETIVRQQGGVLVLSNSSGQSGSITLSMPNNQPIDQPVFLEANLALCANSVAGSIAIAIQSLGLDIGSWFASCGATYQSNQTWGECSDFLWTQQSEHQYKLPQQPFTSGSWHTFRIEVDPAAMMLNYYIDGSLMGSHIPVDAEQLKTANFQFVVNTWKPGIGYPLVGLVDNVRFGTFQP